MNQLENKPKANKNGNGSQLAGVAVSGENQMDQLHIDQPPADHAHMDHSHADQLQVEQSQNDPHFSLRSLRAEAEIYAISRTLEYTGWNRRRAAQLLSISYRGILYKIRQHNLTPRSGREVSVLEQTVKVE
jgi:DNA-binding NtrC family response regulator